MNSGSIKTSQYQKASKGGGARTSASKPSEFLISRSQVGSCCCPFCASFSSPYSRPPTAAFSVSAYELTEEMMAMKLSWRRDNRDGSSKSSLRILSADRSSCELFPWAIHYELGAFIQRSRRSVR